MAQSAFRGSWRNIESHKSPKSDSSSRQTETNCVELKVDTMMMKRRVGSKILAPLSWCTSDYPWWVRWPKNTLSSFAACDYFLHDFIIRFHDFFQFTINVLDDVYKSQPIPVETNHPERCSYKQQSRGGVFSDFVDVAEILKQIDELQRSKI